MHFKFVIIILFLSSACFAQEQAIDFASFVGDIGFNLKQKTSIKDTRFHDYRTVLKSGRRVYEPHPCINGKGSVTTPEEFMATLYNTKDKSSYSKLFMDGETSTPFVKYSELDAANHFALIHKLTFISSGKLHAILKYQKIVNSEISEVTSIVLVEVDGSWYGINNNEFSDYQFAMGNVSTKVFWKLYANFTKPEEAFLLEIYNEVNEVDNGFNVLTLADVIRNAQKNDPALFEKLTKDKFDKK